MHSFKEQFEQAPLGQRAQRHGDVRVQVHFILDVTTAVEGFDQHSHDTDKRRRGQTHHDVLSAE